MGGTRPSCGTKRTKCTTVPLNPGKMVRLRAIKILLICFIVHSCDPSYVLIIQNRSTESVRVTVRINSTRQIYFDSLFVANQVFESKIDHNLFVTTIPIEIKNSLTYRFTLPQGMSSIAPPSSMSGAPDIEYVILQSNDKIDTLHILGRGRKKGIDHRRGFMLNNFVIDHHNR